jgi:GNAT superfamily N-acetyltransferase
VAGGRSVSEPLAALQAHLTGWLGGWPPVGKVDIVESEARILPGWDGRIYSVIGVMTPDGGVISVPPGTAESARAVLARRPVGSPGPILRDLPAALGRPGGRLIEGIYRFCTEASDLPDAGEWRPASDRAVPAWLKPFGGDVLVVVDNAGRYQAGVGLERHADHGWEIAVGTEPEVRGQGLARRLVARAARSALDAGRIPIYVHAVDNVASAHVADAAGFPNRGWRMVAVSG